MSKTYIGLMSGTSLDGIDAAIITTDGTNIDNYGATLYQPYTQSFQQQLNSLINGQAADWLLIEKELTKLHADAVLALLTKAALPRSAISAIGFHGQTIIHRPAEAITWQIGNGALLTELTGIDVICDFRRRDIAAGGCGAPLVPVFHQAMFNNTQPPYAVLNIGGISNITYVDEHNNLLAFDCGPANAIINDACLKYFKLPYDANGLLARRGQINQDFVNYCLQDPYFQQLPPKALDRNHFKKLVSQIEQFENDPFNIMASLTALVAHCIRIAVIDHLTILPKQIYIAGGGVKNKYLVDLIQQYLPILTISNVAADNFDADFVEAQAFAYLAARIVNNLPISFPTTTGNRQALCGAAWYRF